MTRMRSSPTPLTISTARPCPPLPALAHFSLVVPSHSAIVYTRKQRFHHRPPRPTSTRTQRTRAERGPLPWGAKSASSTSTSRRHAENCGQPGYSLTPDTLRPKATLLFPSRILLLPTNARLSATRTPAPHRNNARRHPSLRTHAHALPAARDDEVAPCPRRRASRQGEKYGTSVVPRPRSSFTYSLLQSTIRMHCPIPPALLELSLPARSGRCCVCGACDGERRVKHAARRPSLPTAHIPSGTACSRTHECRRRSRPTT
ncbi:hypothetical protein K438DRAFT_180636 [Mycena galopus ATCC 62051]|nr:hypothetical protein K438DRAFT_180636 [Mycena galopus ATCC 62051]